MSTHKNLHNLNTYKSKIRIQTIRLLLIYHLYVIKVDFFQNLYRRNYGNKRLWRQRLYITRNRYASDVIESGSTLPLGGCSSRVSYSFLYKIIIFNIIVKKYK